MKRNIVAALLVVVGLLALRATVHACGDKSLSLGGIRSQRALAAKYPASILIYAQPNSRVSAATRELNLQRAFQEVGYSYREVASWSDAEAALASGRFNVVMADLADGTELQERLKSSPARPVVIPIAYRLTKSETTQAKKQYRFLVKAPSQSAQYLNTIADAVRSRAAAAP
jgi:PleD family two-component response regulator